MTDRAPLAERVRTMLASGRSLCEVKMFGALSFMVDDKMVVAVQGDGSLLVRVAAERDAELTALPGARPAEMGAGRIMGPGWVAVDAQAIATDDQLGFWIGVALEHRAQLGGRAR